jgi:[acyl-carrier-protein] S-malonyltransferase
MGRVAYLFPGQGSQTVGMGAAFASSVSACAEVFRRVDEALGFAMSALVATGPAESLALTEHTQPAVLAASVVAWTAAREAGLPPPEAVAGHSLGEYTALVAAGVLSLEDAVRAVRLRGRFMQEAVPVGVGAMAAVLQLAPLVIVDVCREVSAEGDGVVVAANFNGHDQTVIAGHAVAVSRASERCRAAGARRVVPLDVSAPFHSPLMAPVVERLAPVLQGCGFADAAVPVITNVEAAPERSGARLRALLLEQVTAPVRWTEVVQRLAADGFDTFVELGPGTVLSGIAKRLVPGATVVSIGTPDKLEAARALLG